MIRLLVNLFVMVMTLFILFCVWDFSRLVYGKFKKLIVNAHDIRKARKKAKRDIKNRKQKEKEDIESILSSQYGDITLLGVGNGREKEKI